MPNQQLMFRLNQALRLALAAAILTLPALAGCSMPLTFKRTSDDLADQRRDAAARLDESPPPPRVYEPYTDPARRHRADDAAAAAPVGEPTAESAAAPAALTDESAPYSAAPAELTPVDQLVINGEKVKAEAILADVRSDLEQRSRSMPPRAYQEYVIQLAVQRIRDRLSATLLHQHAQLRLSDSERQQIDQMAAAELRRIISAEHGGVQRRFEKEYLEPRGQTMEDVQDQLRREFVVSHYLDQQVRPMVPTPTRAELVELFEQYGEQWRTPERRRMALIDVRAADRSAARVRGEQALAKLQAGEAFDAVAREYSDGLHAAEGGDWGWLTRGSVTERFEPAEAKLFELPAGGTSELVESDAGCFIVRCTEIDPGREPDFEGLQPELRRRYFQGHFNRLIDAEVAKLERTARIEPTDLRQFLAAVVATAPAPSGP